MLTSLFNEDPTILSIPPFSNSVHPFPNFPVTSNPHLHCSFCCHVSLAEWVITPHLMCKHTTTHSKHTNTQHTQGPVDWHTHINTYLHNVLFAHSSCLYYIKWFNDYFTDIKNLLSTMSFLFKNSLVKVIYLLIALKHK